MVIYDELKKDHATVKNLLGKLIATDKEDSKTWKALVKQISEELIPHSRAEEAVLYNTLREIPNAKSIVAHSYQEHMMAEGLLRSLQVMETFDINSINTAKKLKEALEHHIAEEEGRVFSAARQVFTEEEAVGMGEAFLKLKPELKGESFMRNTVELISNLMPERLRTFFRKGSLPEQLGSESRHAS